MVILTKQNRTYNYLNEGSVLSSYTSVCAFSSSSFSTQKCNYLILFGY